MPFFFPPERNWGSEFQAWPALSEQSGLCLPAVNGRSVRCSQASLPSGGRAAKASGLLRGPAEPGAPSPAAKLNTSESEAALLRLALARVALKSHSRK